MRRSRSRLQRHAGWRSDAQNSAPPWRCSWRTVSGVTGRGPSSRSSGGSSSWKRCSRRTHPGSSPPSRRSPSPASPCPKTAGSPMIPGAEVKRHDDGAPEHDVRDRGGRGALPVPPWRTRLGALRLRQPAPVCPGGPRRAGRPYGNAVAHPPLPGAEPAGSLPRVLPHRCERAGNLRYGGASRPGLHPPPLRSARSPPPSLHLGVPATAFAALLLDPPAVLSALPPVGLPAAAVEAALRGDHARSAVLLAALAGLAAAPFLLRRRA